MLCCGASAGVTGRIQVRAPAQVRLKGAEGFAVCGATVPVRQTLELQHCAWTHWGASVGEKGGSVVGEA